MNWKTRLATLALGLGAWYTLVGGVDESRRKPQTEYPLPEEIEVVETTLPFETRIRKGQFRNEEGEILERSVSEKYIKTRDIDFSKSFQIKTDRYNYRKDEDLWISKQFGKIFSLPRKLFFWDWDVGKGLDEIRAQEDLSFLENNENLDGLTLRLNHNRVWYDTFRLFFDDEVKERNPWLTRSTLGLLSTLGGEFFSELSRTDYYNPMTQSVIVYSNIESIFAHEIGHHRDFQRFDSDWWYTLGRGIMPIMLFQEGRASLYAKDMLSEYDNKQFARYLIPAFFTYLMASWGLAARQVKRRKLSEEDGYFEASKRFIFSRFDDQEKKELIKDLKSIQVSPLEVGLRFLNQNIAFYSGVGTSMVLGGPLGVLAGTGLYLTINQSTYHLERRLDR